MIQNIQLEHYQNTKSETQFPLSILANDIEIAGNIGSLFRIADAFGLEKLYLTGTTSVPPKYKIRKAARSADQTVPFEYSQSALQTCEQLKQNNYFLICLEITNKSLSLKQYVSNHKKPFNKKACLIIGSENKGINQNLLDLADETLHIPMYGKNSSMNVATSCAIAVYELIGLYQ